MDKSENTLPINEKDELLTLLQNFSNLRTGQDQVLWSIFGAFWGTNALLLIGLFSANDGWETNKIGIIVSIIGLLISLVWTRIQSRTLNRIEMYEDSIQKIEKKLFLDETLCTFSRTPKPSKIFPKLKARHVMNFNCNH